MAGPWEQYQSADTGPWTQFAAPAAQPSFGQHMLGAVTDIPREIYNAGASALDTINDNLNPFSANRQAATERRSKEPFFSPEGLSGITGAGAGLLGVPQFLASTPTGIGRSVIGHTMAAITPGTDYEQGKAIADKAMMAARPAGKFATYQTPAGPSVTLTPPNGPPINMTQPASKVVEFSPPTKPALVSSSADIKDAGKAGYQSPEVTGLDINPQSTAALSSKIENDLLKRGFRAGSAKDVFDEVKDLTPGNGVQSVKVADLDNARQALNIYAKEVDIKGQPTPKAAAARIAINHIDDYLVSLAPQDVLAGNAKAAQATLKQARANYASGSRAQEVDFRLTQAERQAAKTGSGSNIENAMRQKIDRVPEYGLTAEEKTLRDKIVLGDKTRNTLRKVGKLGVDGGLSLLLHTMLGFGSGGATLPIAAAGTVARKVGEMLTAKQIAELNKMIRSRSPLAQSMPPRQMPPPSPLLGSIFPYGLSQRLPLFPGAVPASADDEQPVGGWR